LTAAAVGRRVEWPFGARTTWGNVDGGVMGFFAAGGMLLWGLFALIPILLHFLRKRRRMVVPWGGMRFFQGLLPRQAARFNRLQNLLLLVRVLLVLFLASALARPLLRGPTREGERGERRNLLRVVVIDTSSSMRAVLRRDGQGSTETPLDRAKRAAITWIQNAEPGDGALVLRADWEPRGVIGQVSYETAEVIDQLQRIGAGAGIMKLEQVIPFVVERVEEGIAAGWDGAIEIVLFSDLQQTSWRADDSGEETRLLVPPRATSRGEEPLVWRVADCGAEQMPGNLSVQTLDCRPGTDQAGIDLTHCLASIAHLSGDAAVEGGVVQWIVDGRIEQVEPFPPVPVGGSQVVTWSTRLSPGTHSLEVRLQVDDALVADNQRFHWIDRRELSSVLLVGPTEEDRRFVQLALRSSAASTLQLRSLPQDRLEQLAPQPGQVWVLCNPASLTPGQQRHLREHGKMGGGIVWWLGPKWSADAGMMEWTSEDLPPLSSIDPQSLRWRAVETSTASSVQLDPRDYRSPIIASFASFPRAGLLELPIFRWWKIDFAGAWDVALQIQGSDSPLDSATPLIASLAIEGLGRQVVVATPPGPGPIESPPVPAWNAIVAWPVFLPLVQESIAWAAISPTGPAQLEVGQWLWGTGSREDLRNEQRRNVQRRNKDLRQADLGTYILGPDDQRLEIRHDRSGTRGVRWRAGPAASPGIYRWGDGQGAGRSVAVVNLPAEEGRLVRAETLPRLFTRFMDVLPAADTEALDSAAELDAEGKKLPASPPVTSRLGTEIAWWLLLVAAGLVLLESTLVRYLVGRF